MLLIEKSMQIKKRKERKKNFKKIKKTEKRVWFYAKTLTEADKT